MGSVLSSHTPDPAIQVRHRSWRIQLNMWVAVLAPIFDLHWPPSIVNDGGLCALASCPCMSFWRQVQYCIFKALINVLIKMYLKLALPITRKQCWKLVFLFSKVSLSIFFFVLYVFYCIKDQQLVNVEWVHILCPLFSVWEPNNNNKEAGGERWMPSQVGDKCTGEEQFLEMPLGR